MPYDIAEVKKLLGGLYRSSEISSSDYDVWEKALEKTGRIIPYDKLPPDMQVNIQFQTDTQYRNFALNEWLEPKLDGLSQFGFNSPIQHHDLHWRWDKEGDMWYFRVLFPFEPVSTPYQFNQGGIVSQSKTFFDSRQSDFNSTLFELGEKVAKDFFDAKGMGYGSEVFLGDYDSGVKKYSDEIGFSNYGMFSHGHNGDMRNSDLIKTEVYVAKAVVSGVKNMHDEAFLSEGFSQLTNFFKLIETKDGFFMPYMKSCSFIMETNNVIVYDEDNLNNRENGLFMFLPSIQVKGRLYFEAGYEHEGGFKRDLPIYPQRENSLDANSPISDRLIEQKKKQGAIWVGNKGTLEQYVFLGGMMHDSALQKNCVHCWIDGFKGNRGCSKCENDERYAKPNQHKIEIRVLGADFDDSMKGMGIINHTIIGVTPRVIVADTPQRRK